jgi:3'(2'), 5'-bisphosphate nucleotidase
VNTGTSQDAARCELIGHLAKTAVSAGLTIMRHYEAGCAVKTKPDQSPVTAADADAEAIILRDLAELAPDVPVIAEEAMAAGDVPDTAGHFFLVDPLDGTKEFVERRDDFTVNIALVEHHSPSLGVVYAPAHRQLYVGDVMAGVAWTATVDADGTIGKPAPLRIRACPTGDLSVVASKSHNTPETDAYLAQFQVGERVSCGSSLKICRIAEGRADLYPRLGPTCEWDIGAGDAVLRAAGGRLLAPDGELMRYGKPDFFNPGFVAAGDLAPTPIEPFMRVQARAPYP